jgi:hypothetical protein
MVAADAILMWSVAGVLFVGVLIGLADLVRQLEPAPDAPAAAELAEQHADE